MGMSMRILRMSVMGYEDVEDEYDEVDGAGEDEDDGEGGC